MVGGVLLSLERKGTILCFCFCLLNSSFGGGANYYCFSRYNLIGIHGLDTVIVSYYNLQLLLLVIVPFTITTFFPFHCLVDSLMLVCSMNIEINRFVLYFPSFSTRLYDLTNRELKEKHFINILNKNKKSICNENRTSSIFCQNNGQWVWVLDLSIIFPSILLLCRL